MKKIHFFLLVHLFLSITTVHAQLLKKIRQKAEDAVNKTIENGGDKKSPESKRDHESSGDGQTVSIKADNGKPNLKVYSKFDFVPGSVILYYDNFEKDNIVEAPMGWITSTSAEVVTIDGLEGNWVKMAATSSQHFIRSKKQSWGNNFSIEFDLLMVENDYDPRIDINLINTGNNMVTDEGILRADKKPAINFSAIIGAEKQCRASLYAFDKKFSDVMTESLPYSNTVPVHISMCVQGKRFRMWWNDRKLYDLAAVSEDYVPNQLQFAFGSVGGSDFYVSNIRIAKDIPDTRAKFEEGKLVSNLLFYTGTAKLKPESMGSLLDVSKILKDVTAPVKIVGHTDSDGDDAANVKLSQ
ncbi:MAG: OmpA family protein, partial [Ginsengibacter sp.]